MPWNCPGRFSLYFFMLSCTVPDFIYRIPVLGEFQAVCPWPPFPLGSSDCYYWFVWTHFPHPQTSPLARYFLSFLGCRPAKLGRVAHTCLFCLLSSQVLIYPLLSGVRLCGAVASPALICSCLRLSGGLLHYSVLQPRFLVLK